MSKTKDEQIKDLKAKNKRQAGIIGTYRKDMRYIDNDIKSKDRTLEARNQKVIQLEDEKNTLQGTINEGKEDLKRSREVNAGQREEMNDLWHKLGDKEEEVKVLKEGIVRLATKLP